MQIGAAKIMKEAAAIQPPMPQKRADETAAQIRGFLI